MTTSTSDQHSPRDGHVDGSTSRGHLVVVANRLPVRAVVRAGRRVGWERSPGGLVAALEPAIHTHRTTWVGWSGDSGQRLKPFRYDGVDLVPVTLGTADVDGYYSGFSNSTLWPLYHDAIFAPSFDESWWSSYEAVNRRFAEMAASVAEPGATVWIHDYHLHLVPRMLRELRSDVRIGFFLHIPFPAQELFLRLPWRDDLVRGTLGADVVGFQTRVGADNFRRVARRLLGVGYRSSQIDYGDRQITVDTFAVGIDADRIAGIARRPETRTQARRIRADLGDPRVVLLGVDRLDYTKGIDIRFRAIRSLLDEGRLDPRSTVFVQIAQPSRDELPGYVETRELVETMAGGINGDHARLGHPVVHYLRQGFELADLIALYQAADVMLVTPYRDGMNLVAKEFVASRRDHDGVLILSEFTGAAHQMKSAMLVNPFDIEAVKDAIVDAIGVIHGAPVQARRAMRRLEAGVVRENAAHWAARFLGALDVER